MDLKEIMKKKNFVVVGDTLNSEKYAYKIKHELIDHGYNVDCVGKEKESINDILFDIEVLDLCIHPSKGIKLLKESKQKDFVVVIQPGAESEEIFAYLKENQIDYIEGCLLVGLRLYSNTI